MEQFFDLHQVPTLQKVTLVSLYLYHDKFVWYKWLYEQKQESIVFWSIFTNELIVYYGDIKSNTFLSQLLNIRKINLITKYIQQFQKICLRVKNIIEDTLVDLVMRT